MGGLKVNFVSTLFIEHEITVSRIPQPVSSPHLELSPGRTYIRRSTRDGRLALVQRRGPVEGAFGFRGIAEALFSSRARWRESDRIQPINRVVSAPPTAQYRMAPQLQQMHFDTPCPGLATSVAHQTTITYSDVALPGPPARPPPAFQSDAQLLQPILAEVSAEVINEGETRRHTCASCGKFRSPSYQNLHPLTRGEIPKPAICGRCRRQQTSSEGSDRSYRRSRSYHFGRRGGHHRRRRRHHRYQQNRATGSSEERKDMRSPNEEIHVIRHSRSSSGGRRGHRRSSSSSKHSARVHVSVSPETRRSRERPSEDGVEIIERIHFVPHSGRPRVNRRSESRSSHSHRALRDDLLANAYHGQHDHFHHFIHQDVRGPQLHRVYSQDYKDSGGWGQEEYRPSFGRRPVSLSARHRSPSHAEKEECYEMPRRAYARQSYDDVDVVERPHQHESRPHGPLGPPSRPVRIINVADEESRARRFALNKGDPDTRHVRVAFETETLPSHRLDRRFFDDREDSGQYQPRRRNASYVDGHGSDESHSLLGGTVRSRTC